MIKMRAIGLSLCLAGAQVAYAAETILPITPPGGTDLNQAVLPPTGLYGALVSIPFNQNQHLYDANGSRVPAASDIKVSVPIMAAALAYIYPWDLWGGSLGTAVIAPIERIDYNIGDSLKGRVQGLADIYSDILFYSKNAGLFGVTPGKLPLPYGLTLGGALSAKFPTGSYRVNNPLNVGSNIYVWIPNLAATYTTGPNMSLGDSSQVSARVFYGLPTTNPATGYSTGHILNIDFSATQIFGRFSVGLAGVYQAQVSDDRVRGGLPLSNGNRFDLFALGPVIQYVTDDGYILKAKYQPAIFQHNFVDEQLLFFSVSKQLN